jgi:hypothetical protein
LFTISNEKGRPDKFKWLLLARGNYELAWGREG